MRSKFIFLALMLSWFFAFAIGWHAKPAPTVKKYKAISYLNFEYRATDSVWTIVPHTVLVINDTLHLHRAEITADSIMISQTLRIDTVVNSGLGIKIGGDGPRKGIHIETINLP